MGERSSDMAGCRAGTSIALVWGLALSAAGAGSAAGEAAARVLDADACGNGGVVLSQVANHGDVLAPALYRKFEDRKHGISLDLYPAVISNGRPREPEPAEFKGRFLETIVSALCLWRAVPESYRRLANGPSGGTGIKAIVIGAGEQSSYNNATGIIAIGREKFSTRTWREGEPYDLFSPLSWATALVHETQHKEQARTGVVTRDGFPAYVEYFDYTEFHATLYSLWFLESLPEDLRGPEDSYRQSVLRTKRMLHKNEISEQWFDPSRSALFNICRVEQHFFEVEFADRGFSRAAICEGVETDPPKPDIPTGQGEHDRRFDEMLNQLISR